MKTTIPRLRRIIRNVITESIPSEGKGSIDDVIEQCVKDCQADPNASVETICEQWLSAYGIPYYEYESVIEAVYSRL